MSATARPQEVAGAEAELARDYDRLKPELLRTVRGRLAAGGLHADDADLEGFYNQAWHALYVKLVDGEPIESRNGLLVSIMHRRAIDEYRVRRPDAHGDPDALEHEAVEPDLARELDDRVRVAHLIEGFRERLADRELQAAMLCYVHDFSRTEAAERLGIRPRRMKKLMDDVSKKVGELVGDLSGGDWCDSRRSLIKAYALGLLDRDGQRYALASDHLRSCSACRHRVLALRGLAGVAPPLPALLAALPSADAPRGRPRRPDAARRVGSKATALGVTGALVAAIATVAALRAGDDPPPPRAGGAAVGAAPARPASTANVPAAKARRESDRRAARERARRTARERAQARRARQAERRKRSAQPAATTAPPATATPAPVATAAPAATPPPAATAPTPQATAAPETRQSPARDGWEEFELD